MAEYAAVASASTGGSTVVEDGSYVELEDIPIRNDTYPPGVVAILSEPTPAARQTHEDLTTAVGAWARPDTATRPNTPATQRSWFFAASDPLVRAWRRFVGAQEPAPARHDIELGPAVPPHDAEDIAPDTRPESGTSFSRSDGSIAELLQHALEPYLTHERAVTLMNTWLGGFFFVILGFLVLPLIMEFRNDGVPSSVWLPLALLAAALVAGVVLALVLPWPSHSFILIFLLCISTLVGLLHRAKS